MLHCTFGLHHLVNLQTAKALQQAGSLSTLGLLYISRLKYTRCCFQLLRACALLPLHQCTGFSMEGHGLQRGYKPRWQDHLCEAECLF